jgi:hypothetical protein
VDASEKSARYSDELKLELARAGGHLDSVKAQSPGMMQLSTPIAHVGNGNGSPAVKVDDKSGVKQEVDGMQVDEGLANGTGQPSTLKPTINGSSIPQNGTVDNHHLLEHQSREIASLRAECLQLRKDKDEISAWVMAPTDEIIAQTPLYKALVEKFAENMVGYKTRSVRGEEAIEAANAMRDDMERFRESALVSRRRRKSMSLQSDGCLIARTPHGSGRHKKPIARQRVRSSETPRSKRRAQRRE